MIRPYTATDLGDVQALLVAEGWGARAADTQRLAATVAAADRAVVAEVGGRIVGFGRAVTDGVSNGYLSMLIVHPGHRRQGIGREIVAELTGDDERITWVLRAGHRGSDRFWEAVGFHRSDVAFERLRRR